MKIYELVPEIKLNYTDEQLSTFTQKDLEMVVYEFIDNCIEFDRIIPLNKYINNVSKYHVDEALSMVIEGVTLTEEWNDFFLSINYRYKLIHTMLSAFQKNYLAFFNGIQDKSEFELFKKVSFISSLGFNDSTYQLYNNFHINLGRYSLKEIMDYDKNQSWGGYILLYSLKEWQPAMNLFFETVRTNGENWEIDIKNKGNLILSQQKIQQF